MLKFANHTHFKDIQRMSRLFKANSPYKDDPLDEGKMNDVIIALMGAPREEAILIVYEVDGKAVGLIAGQITEILFNRSKVAAEIVWWVDPEYRRSRAGISLLAAFEEWAKRNGCSKIQMVAVDTEQQEAVEGLYRRRGYYNAENSFVKDI